MKILHFSNTHAYEGAARGAFRVHRGLIELGHDSSFVVARKFTDDPRITQITPRVHVARVSRFVRCWRERRRLQCVWQNPPHTFWSEPRTRYRPSDLVDLPVPDIYNLHWVAQFLDWPTMLPWLAQRAPIVWTLRDLNPILGIWHYQPDQEEQSDARNRLDRAAFEIKAKTLSQVPQDRLHLIASSKWMEKQIKTSELMGRFQVRHIPHSLETQVFKPIPKHTARQALGFDAEGCCWLGFVAGNVQDPRKGLDLLRRALKRVRASEPIRILAAGEGDAEAIAGHEVVHLGAIRSDRLLSLFYNALDVFVCPSLQEAFGQTVFEAMSCGTPVVGFDTGGVPDMVRPGETGWLAETGDVVSLAQIIESSLADQDRLAGMGRRCREVVENEYRSEIQAQRYSDYFSEITGKPVGV